MGFLSFTPAPSSETNPLSFVEGQYHLPFPLPPNHTRLPVYRLHSKPGLGNCLGKTGKTNTLVLSTVRQRWMTSFLLQRKQLHVRHYWKQCCNILSTFYHKSKALFNSTSTHPAIGICQFWKRLPGRCHYVFIVRSESSLDEANSALQKPLPLGFQYLGKV